MCRFLQLREIFPSISTDPHSATLSTSIYGELDSTGILRMAKIRVPKSSLGDEGLGSPGAMVLVPRYTGDWLSEHQQRIPVFTQG